ncbi:MAG: hypothetical protein OXN17_03755 [Candidatus Poribacteria bacterium]|nr:hypothetical protein [Candidatus Poribacteria bacterium]MDE0504923.1 hypothetical protein [Candidatus Poribacteria bacterium]
MKVSILGRCDSTLAVASEICKSDIVSEVVLVDETRRLTRGVVHELEASFALGGHDATISVSRTVSALTGSEVAILLSPSERVSFYSSQSNRNTNLAFARHSAKQIKQYAPQVRILVAMPSANFLAHMIHHELDSEPGQVIGLSSSRAGAHLKHQIANRFGVSATDVAVMVIGSDDRILVLPQYCRISGIPIDQLLGDAQIHDLTVRINDWHRAPTHAESSHSLSMCLRQIVDAIGLDRRKIICVSTLIRAGASSVYLSVPAKIGSHGVEEIVKLELTDEQLQHFSQMVSRSVANQRPKSGNQLRGLME